jgi:hypothetical protein
MDDYSLLADAYRPDIIRCNAGNGIKGVGQNAMTNIRRFDLRPGGAIPVQGERSIWRAIALTDRPDVIDRDREDTVKAIANEAGIGTWDAVPRFFLYG